MHVHIVHNMELLATITYGLGLHSLDCVSWSTTPGALAKCEQTQVVEGQQLRDDLYSATRIRAL